MNAAIVRAFAPIALGIGILWASAAVAATTGGNSVRVDNARVKVWNRFADDLYKVHRHLIRAHRTRMVETVGGYANMPAFYREESHFDAETGRLLSRVQWERERPANLHAIEIYFYDEAGRVRRDYSATFLPVHRNAPIQTLVNLHHHDKDLHAFRQFDASGDRIYEQCRGTHFDEKVDLSIPDPLVGTPRSVLESEAYVACFGFLPADAGDALDPTAAFPELGGRTSSLGQDDAFTQALKRIAALTAGIEKTPSDPQLYLQRGDLYFDIRSFDSAIDDYTRAIALDDTLDKAYFGRGMALGRKGAVDEGIADLSVFIARNPGDSVALTKRGVRHIWKGDFAAAEKDLTEAIRIDPSNAEAHDDLGVVLAQRGEHKTAETHFRATIRLDPSYQKAYHNLALALQLQGKNRPALAAVDDALRLSPDNRDSVMLKSVILDSLGRRDEARRYKEDAEFLPQGNWSETLPIR